MRMMTMLAGVVLALVAGSAATQARRPAPVPPPLMEARQAETPIRVESASLGVRTVGGHAETSVELVFHNPNARQLEGHLQFPLLPGQQVTGFALDIDGEMRPAVAVPKAKGRQVFEEIQRRQVDPALLEQTEGNFFRLRVYPIPPLGTRRVRLEISEAMERERDGWRLALPLQFAADAAAVDLRVEGGAKDPPRLSGTFGAVELDRRGRSHSIRLPRSSWRPDTPLELHFAAATEPRSHVQAIEGEHYFVAEVPVVAPTAGQRRLPAVVGLLWDSSGSARSRDLAAELALLDRYFRAAGDIEVRLVRLRDIAAPVEYHRVRGGNWQTLRIALQETTLDGASSLDGWEPEPTVDEYLLFSDGLFNYGGQQFPQLSRGQRLYTLNSAGAASDPGRLAALADAHGGRAITMRGAGQIDRASTELLMEGARVVDLRALGATDLVRASAHPEDGYFRIAGRLTAPSARVALDIESAGLTRTLEFQVASAGEQGVFAARAWADYALRALQGDREGNAAAIERLGRRFGIVTPGTSLLVLDDINDYVRYEIEPPASLAKEYARLSAVRARSENTSRQANLDRVAADYAEREQWWSTRWPKAPRPREKEFGPRGTTAAAERERQASPIQPSMVAPPPPASLAMPAEATTSVAAPAPDGIAVTGSRMDTPVDSEADGVETQIVLQPWRPDSAYARRLRAAAAPDVYRMYLDERDSHSDSTAFYLDVAGILFERGQPELALRVLSNLAEMDLGNRHVLRVLGYRLMEADRADLAAPIFRQVVGLAGEEPQSFRDLGLALAASGDAQGAVENLYQVVERGWDRRFPGIAQTALVELNAIVADTKHTVDVSMVDPRLLRNMPLDLRVVLSWDSDNSDMDLWVTDPDGEKCYFSNRATWQGGRMSPDFTGGYGPEEFALRDAKPGVYRVQANFYGDRQQLVTGATTLQLWLSTGFGTARQQDRKVTMRLSERSETVLVGEFTVD